jgi:GTPase SAR1 family protein
MVNGISAPLPCFCSSNTYPGFSGETKLQVLCVAAGEFGDVVCKLCGEKYKLYFERPSRSEREEAVAVVMQALANHHHAVDGPSAHPKKPFNVPEWSGPAEWSAAALLGGAPIGG